MSEAVDEEKNLRLVAAAALGDMSGAAQALRDGADIHYDDDGALRGAALLGEKNIVKWLLEQGANIHAGDEMVLLSAIIHRDNVLIDIALAKGASVQAVLDYHKDNLDSESLNIIGDIQSRGSREALEAFRKKKKPHIIIKPKSP